MATARAPARAVEENIQRAKDTKPAPAAGEGAARRRALGDIGNVGGVTTRAQAAAKDGKVAAKPTALKPRDANLTAAVLRSRATSASQKKAGSSLSSLLQSRSEAAAAAAARRGASLDLAAVLRRKLTSAGSASVTVSATTSSTDEIRIVVDATNDGPPSAAGIAPAGAAAAAAALPPGWPSTGDLQFERVSLRYFPGGPLALRGVSFHVRDCEKIGIVGRTGSGKTTMLMALFRLLDLAGGRVLVDGADIAALPLKEVRRHISIIPQEPVMFKGTVRSNLDPFGEAPDNELWHALKLVHLRDAIADMPGGLDGPVSEGGANFSLGQRQLVCMARCVLKRTRVLVLDEATAAIDLQTDALIQRTIRRVFRGRTTLTIAHRLDTIMFSDKILAMGQGKVREFGAPAALLADPSSMFNKLVEDTGPAASAALRAMAAAGPPPDPEEAGGGRGSFEGA